MGDRIMQQDWSDEELPLMVEALELFKKIQNELGFHTAVNIWLNILNSVEPLGFTVIVPAALRMCTHMTNLVENGLDNEKTIEH